MKKNYELYSMVKEIIGIDCVIGIVLIFAIPQINREYTWAFFIGFFLAIINFYINANTVNYGFSRKNSKIASMIALSYYFRVIIVGIMGVILFAHNKLNILAYVLGYNTHILSLILYAVNLRMLKKRSE